MFAKQGSAKGDILLEYVGEWKSLEDGKRGLKYGSYIFFGVANEKGEQMCVDANSMDRLGKFVNDTSP